MNLFEITLVLLFAAYLIGTVFRILAMLERKRADGQVERARLVFFFTACLMAVCLIPLALFDLLTGPVLACDLAVVGADLVGYALTFDFAFLNALGLGRGGRGAGEAARTTRVYQLYREGVRFGMISRADFDKLLAHDLLKKQRTVELVDDYRQKSRDKGVQIHVLKNRDGSQTLIKVEAPEPG